MVTKTINYFTIKSKEFNYDSIVEEDLDEIILDLGLESNFEDF